MSHGRGLQLPNETILLLDDLLAVFHSFGERSPGDSAVEDGSLRSDKDRNGLRWAGTAVSSLSTAK